MSHSVAGLVAYRPGVDVVGVAPVGLGPADHAPWSRSAEACSLVGGRDEAFGPADVEQSPSTR
jgi:hypothetical protein